MPKAQNRHVRRDLLDAISLRIVLALQFNDRVSAGAAVDALRAPYDKEVTLTSAEDVGRYSLSRVTAGMAMSVAGKSPETDAFFAAARHALEPYARTSGYWRILDPWLRLSLLTGDGAEAERVKTQLTGYGYVPLFPWPAAKTTDANSGAADATRSRPSPAKQSPMRSHDRIRQPQAATTAHH